MDCDLDYGPALIEHILLKHKFTNASKIGKTFNIENDLQELFLAIQDGEAILQTARKQHSKVKQLLLPLLLDIEFSFTS